MARFGAGATVYRTGGPACDGTLSPRRSVPVQHGGASARAIHVSCTRGQARPRNGSQRSFASGQEGPRTHLVTIDGALWIAGACHKGLGGDHIGKTLGTTGSDHLTFYRVGGRAQRVDTQEAVLTGAAEDWPHDPLLASRRMGMADPAAFGADGATGYLSGVRIISSCPSHIHSLALSEDGRAWGWLHGRTGLQLYSGPRDKTAASLHLVLAPSGVGHHIACTPDVWRYWSFGGYQKQPELPSGLPWPPRWAWRMCEYGVVRASADLTDACGADTSRHGAKRAKRQPASADSTEYA